MECLFHLLWFITDKLKEAGIAVWVETYDLGGGANVFSKVGQAVVDAKVILKTTRFKYKQSYNTVKACNFWEVIFQSRV